MGLIIFQVSSIAFLNSFFQENFEEYRQLFHLDPLLLQVFIYLTPKKDIPTRLEQTPPYLSTTWLALQLSVDPTGYVNRSEVRMQYPLTTVIVQFAQGCLTQ